MTRFSAAPDHLERRTIVAGGLERTYWVAGNSDPRAPLIMAFHGLAMTARHLASWTGLATRGPAAGFATVFPAGIGEMWDDTGRGRVDRVDDDAFARALVADLTDERTAATRPLFVVGLSNGGFFAERLTRSGILTPQGLVLVVSTTRHATRRATPRPKAGTALLCFAGTADRLVPYGGGRSMGIQASLARRRMSRRLLDPSGREVVSVETLARDWAVVNGCEERPTVEPVPGTDLTVKRMTWQSPAGPPVIVYRIEGGAHGWPGGPQYLPARLIGRIPKRLDATGILVSFAESLLDRAATTERGPAD